MVFAFLVAVKAGRGVGAGGVATEVRVAAKVGAEGLEFGRCGIWMVLVLDDVPYGRFVILEDVIHTCGRHYLD